MLKFLIARHVFNLLLYFAKVFSSSYRFFKIDKAARVFYPLLAKFFIGKKIILANEFLSRGSSVKQVPSPKSQKQKFKVVYFKGCVNEYINPRTKNAVEYLLRQMNVEILPIKFECCGVPFLSSGNVGQFLKQAEFNISQIPDEFDYFLTDCASCQDAFFEYENYVQDEKLLKKLKNINEKSLNVVEFIVEKLKSIEFDKMTSFTFHEPCHMKNVSFLKEFLAKSKNLEYIEMNDFDKCCGFAGEFAIKNSTISEKISKIKAENAINTCTDYILTSCPACVLGINQGMIENEEFSKHAINLAEFITKADKLIF